MSEKPNNLPGSTKISDIDFGRPANVKIQNFARRGDIPQTVAEVRKMTDCALLCIAGLGGKTLHALRKIVGQDRA